MCTKEIKYVGEFIVLSFAYYWAKHYMIILLRSFILIFLLWCCVQSFLCFSDIHINIAYYMSIAKGLINAAIMKKNGR